MIKTGVTKDGKSFYRWNNDGSYDYWPISDKPQLKDLKGYDESPIVLVGPSPDWFKECTSMLAMIWDEVVLKSYKIPTSYMAVNYHLLDENVDLFRYVCFLDHPENGYTSDLEKKYYKSFKGIKISTHPDWSDVWISDEVPTNLTDSGLFSAYVAAYLTDKEVYICGFNNRKPGEPMYHEQSNFVKEHGQVYADGKNFHWNAWREFLKSVENPDRIIFMNKEMNKNVRINS